MAQVDAMCMSLDEIIKIRKLNPGARSVRSMKSNASRRSNRSTRSNRSYGGRSVRSNKSFGGRSRKSNRSVRSSQRGWRNGKQQTWNRQRVSPFQRYNGVSPLKRLNIPRPGYYSTAQNRVRLNELHKQYIRNKVKRAATVLNSRQNFSSNYIVKRPFQNNPVAQLKRFQRLHTLTNIYSCSRRQQFLSNVVSGSAQGLQVKISNELAMRPGSSTPHSNFRQQRRKFDFGYMNRKNLAKLGEVKRYSNYSSGASSDGSVITTVSQRSFRSNKNNRNFQNRKGQNAAIVHHMVLNPKIQKAIAHIQGRSNMDVEETAFEPELPNFRATPSCTGTNLNSRFKML